VVDVAYDVDRGVYDLTIQEEGRAEPIVALRDQPGAARQPASAVDVFSFISDPREDISDVTYFVDDVVIATSREVAVPPLVAPGRRKLFVDAFAEYRRMQDAQPRCLPATSLEDLGIGPHETAGPGVLAMLEDILASAIRGEWREPSKDATPPVALAGVRAAAQWRRGCVALEEGRAAIALEQFDGASGLAPRGRIYALSAALALIALGRTEEAEGRLEAIAGDWSDDPRFAIVSARLADARGDVAGGQETLRAAAQRGDGRAAARYYSSLLWDGRWREAGELAAAWARRTAGAAESAAWLERAGDAAFHLREIAAARDLYEEAGRAAPEEASIVLKLADVAFVLGDLDSERRYRERYYGTLDPP
jgi:tetratricopeptide (TPR) repeat protein